MNQLILKEMIVWNNAISLYSKAANLNQDAKTMKE